MNPLNLIRQMVRKTGFDIVRYQRWTHPVARRLYFFKSFGIDTVIDVGANVGQYGISLRDLGFKGRIVSFEPLLEPYKRLQVNAGNDACRNWQTANLALGDKDEEALIHVSENSQSSSILRPTDFALTLSGTQEVACAQIVDRRLDSLIDAYVSPNNRVFLKIDAQGYEKRILEGATDFLKRISGVQVELSLAPQYVGESLLPEMFAWITDKGFELVSIEPVLADPETAKLLQVDATFFRIATS